MKFKPLVLFFILVVTGTPLFAGQSRRSCRDQLNPWLKQVESRLRDTTYKPLFSTDTDYIASGKMRIESRTYPQLNMRTSESLGSRPFDKSDRFLVDDEYPQMIRLKQKIVDEGDGIKNALIKSRKGVIKVHRNFERQLFQATTQLLEEIFADLPEKFPKVFSKRGSHLIRLSDNKSWVIEANSASENLKVLSEILAEDLVFSVRGQDGLFYLAGGVLAFPSRWSFQRLLGESSKQIHDRMFKGPLGGAGPTLSEIIERELNEIVKTDRVTVRNNWAIYTNPVYAQPDYGDYALPRRDRLTLDNINERVFIRSEYETLSKLSDDVVLFTIRPYMFKLDRVTSVPGFSAQLLEAVKKRYAANYDEIPYYKVLLRYLESRVTAEGQFPPKDTRVLQVQRLTDNHSLVRLARPKDLDLVPGQPIRLELTTDEGVKVSRVLSLSSSPNRNYIELAASHSDSDFKSKFLSLRQNDPVVIQPLHGELDYQENHPAVMIAGGIGITPFRSMIQDALDKKSKQPITLIYGNRTQIPFFDELNDANTTRDSIQVTHTLSQPETSWTGRTGRIGEEIISEVVRSAKSDTRYYIVGNSEMVQSTRESLESLGVPQSNILTEIFAGYGVEGKDSDTICFCRSVTKQDIQRTLDEGASCLADIVSQTGATTGCGQCKCDVERMLNK